MASLLKVMGGLWFATGLWILWRNISALGAVTEATRPVGSPLVGQQVLATLVIFLLPGLAVIALAALVFGRRSV